MVWLWCALHGHPRWSYVNRGLVHSHGAAIDVQRWACRCGRRHWVGRRYQPSGEFTDWVRSSR